MTKPTNDILGRDYDAAMAQVEEQAAQVKDNEISVRENPRLAEMQGVTKQLITAGVHQPAGSTVVASDEFGGAASAKPSTKRYDARDKRNDGLQGFEAYVIVNGSFGKVKSTLKDCAETRDAETIIGAEKGKEIGLTAMLTKHEIAHLARFGAEYLDSNKRPVPLNGTPVLSAKIQ